MARIDRIDFQSFDGGQQIQLGRAYVIVIQVLGAGPTTIVLTDTEAEALGRSLVRQARYARTERRATETRIGRTEQ